jgi:hypothetical protein
MVLRSGGLLRDARLLLVCLSLAVAVIGALAILLSVASPVRAQVVSDCATKDEPQVPGAERQDADC